MIRAEPGFLVLGRCVQLKNSMYGSKGRCDQVAACCQQHESIVPRPVYESASGADPELLGSVKSALCRWLSSIELDMPAHLAR
jgi:hypothetical protein